MERSLLLEPHTDYQCSQGAMTNADLISLTRRIVNTPDPATKVKRVGREGCCLKNSWDTVAHSISTRYRRDCRIGFSRLLSLQRRYVRGIIFGIWGLSNSISWFCETSLSYYQNSSLLFG